ncbi:MAG: hypothetical protein LBO67_04735 [Spirochaetaceae bacterium]|jgi:hypothetical protein|nr:hypothetical protein [Spirochaetaceae bacterium]
MNMQEFDRGFEITFNTQHGKNVMQLAMMEFLGARHIEGRDATCFEPMLIAIYNAIKAAKIKEKTIGTAEAGKK